MMFLKFSITGMNRRVNNGEQSSPLFCSKIKSLAYNSYDTLRKDKLYARDFKFFSK